MEELLNVQINKTTEGIIQLISYSGKLRMLSQRISYFIVQIKFMAKDESRKNALVANLKDSYDEFYKLYYILLGNGEKYINRNDRLKKLILDTNNGSTKINKFLETVKKIIQEIEESRPISNSDLEFVIKESNNSLLTHLSDIAIEFGREGSVEFHRDEEGYAKSQKEIIKILKNITEIASSARMISFNAHIIAERAGGDIGKEFSVVAEGISKLTTRIHEFVDRAVDILELE